MDDIKKFIKQAEEEYKKQHPPDFMTHFNYVVCLNAISAELNIGCKLNIKNKINKESKMLQKKLNLTKLIKRNLNEEYETVKQNQAFAEVCVPWIAVKSYYLIFNLLLILDYLVSGQESFFNSSHERLLRRFKDRLGRKEIAFNKKIFNTSFQYSKVMSLQIKPGANLRVVNINLNERIVQILKKLIDYKIEDFQRKEGIKNFRSKKNREKKKDFLDKDTVNIFEFFYWYRIKSNYRDLEFLDKDISDRQFSDFYKNYFELTGKFYTSLKELINDLSSKRLNKEIL
jgi:hypothetical protein